VVGVGGSSRRRSSAEALLRGCLAQAEALGARTRMFSGADLALPMFEPISQARSAQATELVQAFREADGVVLGSPGYHGGISGLVKNALDYIEDLRNDDRPYLDGRAVGCIASASGWQAAGTTLQALRSVVHALRGWPTPLGLAVNSDQYGVGPGGTYDAHVTAQITVVARQVVQFATAWRPAGIGVRAHATAGPAAD
jgi:FMN reductase